MAVSDNRVINIREQVTPTPSETRDFDKALFLFAPPDTNDQSELLAGATVKSYANLDQVAADWPSGTDPYAAASIWFQQTPFPGQFATAGFFEAARDGSQVGSSVDLSSSEATAFGSTAAISFMGQSGTADVSSASSPADVATAVQNGINAISNLTGVTVSASSGAAFGSDHTYTITVPGSEGSDTTLDFTRGFEGELAAAMGFAGNFVRPFAADTDVAVALSRALGIDDTPYWIYLSNPLNTSTNRNSASVWAETRDVLYGFDTNEPEVLDATDVSTNAAGFLAAQRDHTFAFYSQYQDYKAVAMGAVFSGRNDYNAANGTIQGSHKTLVGCLPDRQLTDSDANVLEAKRVNYYERIIGGNSVLYGYTFGDRIDSQVGAAWLVENIQVAGINLLRSTGRVPLTEVGTSLIVAAITAVCERGRFNGIIALAGQLSSQQAQEVGRAIGNPSFTGRLDRGYAVVAGPQLTANTNTRTTPVIIVKALDFRGTDKVLVSLQVL